MASSRSWRNRALALGAVIAMTGIAVPAAWAQGLAYDHVSDNPLGPDSLLDDAFASDLLPDASREAFSTNESLAATDTDAKRDLYLRNNADGSLVHVSGGGAPGEDAFAGARSPDLNLFFIRTTEKLTADDEDSATDFYVRNLTAGTLVLASDTPGEDPNTTSDPDTPVSSDLGSDDGNVQFFSTDEPLLPTDDDATKDQYAYRASTGTLVHLSDDPGETDTTVDPGTHSQFEGSSGDDTRMFFSTTEPMLGSDDDADTDVYARASDGTGSLAHVSDATATSDPDVPAFYEGSSGDGARVFFTTDEPMVAATDGDTAADLYAHEPGGGITHLSDNPITADEEEPVSPTFRSFDGSRIWFSTLEPLADSDDDSARDVYEAGAGGSPLHVSDSPGGLDAEVPVSLVTRSGDSSRLYFRTDESWADSDTDSALDYYMRESLGPPVHVTDRPTGPDTETDMFEINQSADQSHLLLVTAESWAGTDTDSARDVYARDFSGNVTHFSDSPGIDAELDVGFPSAGNGANAVLFDTAEAMAASDTDAKRDVFLARIVPPPGGATGGPSGTTSGPGGGTGPSTDGAPPVLTSVAAVPAVFVLGAALPRLTARRVPVGTSLRLRLNEPARVTFAFQRPLPGRRVGRTCRRPSHALRRRPRCTRYLARGSFTVQGRQGANRVRFQGRLSRRRRLGPGGYRLVARAVDAAGNRSAARTARLRALAPPRRRR